jgi:hypothetical protein
MTRLYLDTEFNGFGGGLMSLALVTDRSDGPEFYRVVHCPGPIDPWVQLHVVPHLDAEPEPRHVVAAALGEFLWDIEKPCIIADWPTDFEHLLALLIAGPGRMHQAPDFEMQFRHLEGFNTATASRRPHNALSDARALRDYCEALETERAR